MKAIMHLKNPIHYVILLGCMFYLSITSLYAQELAVSGNVKDATGEFVIGASVLVKGTTNGTITDIDGNFTLTGLSAGSVIEVSYIGYVTQSLTVKDATPLQIVLKEDTETLDEVVVVGYGVQKKSVVTASIAKVSSDDLASTAPTRMDNALKGLAAGVTVTSSSGQPGGSCTDTCPRYWYHQ